MDWRLPLLRIVQPASAYVQTEQSRARRSFREGRSKVSPNEAGIAPRDLLKLLDGLRKGQPELIEALRVGAEELLATGQTELQAPGATLQSRLVRFWNRSAILDVRRADSNGYRGRTYSLIDRRELMRDPVTRVADHLLHSVVNVSAA